MSLTSAMAVPPSFLLSHCLNNISTSCVGLTYWGTRLSKMLLATVPQSEHDFGYREEKDK
eukprot:Awhi_evm1s13487